MTTRTRNRKRKIQQEEDNQDPNDSLSDFTSRNRDRLLLWFFPKISATTRGLIFVTNKSPGFQSIFKLQRIDFDMLGSRTLDAYIYRVPTIFNAIKRGRDS